MEMDFSSQKIDVDSLHKICCLTTMLHFNL